LIRFFMPFSLSPQSREYFIAAILLKARGEFMQSSEIHGELLRQGVEIALVTTKRTLAALKAAGVISASRKGRSSAYTLTNYGRLIIPVDAHEYCAIEPDKRYGNERFNFDLFESINFDPFTHPERQRIDEATRTFRIRSKDLSSAIAEKELERFIIELSWKSSRIEGNTYSLLDTERLILHGIEAAGHKHEEAQMILNHKEAFKFIRLNASAFMTLTRAGLEQVHQLLVRDLNVSIGLRSKAVGVTGSIYRPLDTVHQITDAVYALCDCIERIESPQAKALLALLGISYVQPFEDGNKRTARLVANAILLAHRCPPLSYRSLDENAYREAMLVFYEINSLIPFLKIFVEQYVFAAENYLL
jgi:fido (protein-threonine AMPylation protein)/predicted transcriptional regulator